jgi:hypothetical protein
LESLSSSEGHHVHLERRVGKETFLCIGTKRLFTGAQAFGGVSETVKKYSKSLIFGFSKNE